MFETTNYKNGMTLERGKLYNGKSGTYRYAQNKMYTAVVKVPTTYGGDELKEQIVGITLPKIPYEMFNNIYEFFKYIYKKHKSEVAVLLWYNFDTDSWETEVPKQTVGPGSVNYTRDEAWANEMIAKGFTCVGTIHSHCEMSAFHSGTDDHDEYNFDGVHITIGKVLSGPEFAQRFIVKEMSKKFEKISDVVEMPEVAPTKFPEGWDEKVGKVVYTPKNTGRKPSLFGGGNYSDKSYNMRFNTDGSLRTPTNQETEATFEEELTQEQKEEAIMYHYNKKTDTYKCPLCITKIPAHQLGKDYTCPDCSFPLYEDEKEWNIEPLDDDWKAYRDIEEEVPFDLYSY